MKNIEVIGLGALNMDNIYRVERILGDGETVADREQVEHILKYQEADLKWIGNFPGGSAANTLFGLAKLGARTGFIGAVGDDAEGKLLIKDLKEAGVDASQIRVKPKAKTGSALCLSDKLNFRSIYITPGANDLLAIDDVDLTYINQAKMLHISSFVGDQQLKILLEIITKLDFSVKISFSPGALYAAKGLQTLKPLLAKTYVLFINESEMRQLTGEDFNSGAKRCLELGCHIVVVTLGEGASYKTVMATSYIRTTEGEYVVKPIDKRIISALDTTGAGDAFAAGFLYGFLNDKGLEECGQIGNIVAQFSIARVGARPGLPTLDQLDQRYRQLYNKKL